jgi:hypothetical protein
MVKELDDISQAVLRRNCQIFAGVSGKSFLKKKLTLKIFWLFQSTMHVNLSFNCARPSFKTSLKDYTN